MQNQCQNVSNLTAAVAYNPFTVDPAKKEKVMSHISSCPSCRGKYGSKVRGRKAMERDGYDPTHQRI